MIESPAYLLALWLLGEGRARRERERMVVEPVDPIPDIDAWPRTVPSGGERPIKLTGGANVTSWRQSRFRAAVDFLSLDNTSIGVLSSLVERGKTSGDYAITDIIISVLAHWDIETASGAHEYNYNVGGIAALPGQVYFAARDATSGVRAAFAAYDSLTQGIADYFGVLSYSRYESALVGLLTTPLNSEWFAALGRAGYYGMAPDQAAQAWLLRRAQVVASVKGAG